MIKRKISWARYNKDIHLLAEKIKEGSRMRYVVGIPRGGIVMAVHLSHILKIPYLSSLSEAYGKERSEVLLCDDVSDGGATLTRLNGGFVTATLYRKDGTIFEPTFHIKTINVWIIFPWEE